MDSDGYSDYFIRNFVFGQKTFLRALCGFFVPLVVFFTAESTKQAQSSPRGICIYYSFDSIQADSNNPDQSALWTAMAIPITLFAISFSIRKLFSVPFVDSLCPSWFYLFYHKVRKAGAKFTKGYLYLSIDLLSASSNFFLNFLKPLFNLFASWLLDVKYFIFLQFSTYLNFR